MKSNRDKILFHIDAVDRPGVLTEITAILTRGSFELSRVGVQTWSNSTAKYFFETLMVSGDYQPLLSACRALQSLERCNHLLAEFTGDRERRNSIKNTGGPQHRSKHGTPFESFFSGQILREEEAIHPGNIADSELRDIVSALDGAVSSFIKEPDRLFRVSPKDLEKIIAAVYTAQHGRVRSSIEASQLFHSQAPGPSEEFKGVFSRNPQHDLGALSISRGHKSRCR